MTRIRILEVMFTFEYFSRTVENFNLFKNREREGVQY